MMDQDGEVRDLNRNRNWVTRIHNFLRNDKCHLDQIKVMEDSNSIITHNTELILNLYKILMINLNTLTSHLNTCTTNHNNLEWEWEWHCQLDDNSIRASLLLLQLIVQFQR